MFAGGVDTRQAEKILAGIGRSSATMAACEIRVLGGAMARVPAGATAFAHRQSRIMINVAAILHVFGVLCERYIIVIPGQTHPQEILPNMNVESVALDGALVGYSISFLEVVQALGIAAIVALAFMLGLRIFAMLPTKALIEDQAS